MSGYQTYTRWQRIEARANALGFRIGNSKHGAWGSDRRLDDVAVYPKDNALPVYSRDAELFCGTFTEMEYFLMGWEKAQQYDMLLRLSDDKKRKKAEVKEVRCYFAVDGMRFTLTLHPRDKWKFWRTAHPLMDYLSIAYDQADGSHR